jgi:hypothetical protein
VVSSPIGARDSLSHCLVGAGCSCRVVQLDLDVHLINRSTKAYS